MSIVATTMLISGGAAAANAQASPARRLGDPAGAERPGRVGVIGGGVSVHADRPLVLYSANADPEFSLRWLCATDCLLHLVSATYRFVAKRPGSGMAWSPPLRINGAGQLRVHYVDNLDVRIGGVIGMAASLLVGAVIMTGAILRGLADPWVNAMETAALLITGGAVAVVGLSIGLGFAFAGDGLEVSFRPHSPDRI